MLSYPIVLATGDGGAILATAPDFPEFEAAGRDRDDALVQAVRALEDAIASRIRSGQVVPPPSRGRTRSTLPTLTAIKVILYQEMNRRGISKAELARRLGWHPTQVGRVLDLRHRSRLDRMDVALRAVGLGLQVKAKTPPTPPPPPP